MISKEKGKTEFEFDVASAILNDADNLPPTEHLCGDIGEEFGSIVAEVPVLPRSTSWDPKPPEQTKKGVSSLQPDKYEAVCQLLPHSSREVRQYNHIFHKSTAT